MKKGIVIATLVLVVGLGIAIGFLPAPAASAQFVELPSELQAGIVALVLTAVSYALVYLATRFPILKFLLPYTEQIAMALAAFLIDLIQNATPDALGPVVVLVIQLILLILSGITLVEKLRKNNVRGFRW